MSLEGNKTSRYDDKSILLKLRHFDNDMQNNRDMSITYPRQVDTRIFNKIYSMTDLIFSRLKWHTFSNIRDGFVLTFADIALYLFRHKHY